MKRRRYRRLRIRRNPLPLIGALPAVAQVAVVGAGAVAAAHVVKNGGLHLGQNKTPGQPPGLYLNPYNPRSKAYDPNAVVHPPSNTEPPEDTRHTALGPA